MGERIERLLEQIILEENSLNVNGSLPGTILDRASVTLSQSFACPIGSVVRGSACVPCPSGTHYSAETMTCEKCPFGTYSTEEAQVECNVCPEVQGRVGVTQTEGSTRMSDCKEQCTPGHYYDEITSLCLPCGIGKFQPDSGKFSCYMCGVGMTTRIKDAMSREECRPECPDGKELDLAGECQPCAAGTYRKKGVHLGCQRCRPGFTTRGQGSISYSDCSLSHLCCRPVPQCHDQRLHRVQPRLLSTRGAADRVPPVPSEHLNKEGWRRVQGRVHQPMPGRGRRARALRQERHLPLPPVQQYAPV